MQGEPQPTSVFRVGTRTVQIDQHEYPQGQ